VHFSKHRYFSNNPYVFSANFVAYCVKNSCHTKVCLQIFALSAKKFARKSAYISYEYKL